MRLFLESFIKIGQVISPNGSGQTDRQTDRQTPQVFFPETITIHLVTEMTKEKSKQKIFGKWQIQMI